MNTILKEKDFDCQVESIDEDKELTIADDFLEKEEEESLIQKFCEMKSKKRIRKFKKSSIAMSPKESTKESK